MLTQASNLQTDSQCWHYNFRQYVWNLLITPHMKLSSVQKFWITSIPGPFREKSVQCLYRYLHMHPLYISKQQFLCITVKTWYEPFVGIFIYLYSTINVRVALDRVKGQVSALRSLQSRNRHKEENEGRDKDEKHVLPQLLPCHQLKHNCKLLDF